MSTITTTMSCLFNANVSSTYGDPCKWLFRHVLITIKAFHTLASNMPWGREGSSRASRRGNGRRAISSFYLFTKANGPFHVIRLPTCNLGTNCRTFVPLSLTRDLIRMALLCSFTSDIKGVSFRSMTNDGLSTPFSNCRRSSRSIIFSFFSRSILTTRLVNGIRTISSFGLFRNGSRNLCTYLTFRTMGSHVRGNCNVIKRSSIQVTCVTYPILRVGRQGIFGLMFPNLNLRSYAPSRRGRREWDGSFRAIFRGLASKTFSTPSYTSGWKHFSGPGVPTEVLHKGQQVLILWTLTASLGLQHSALVQFSMPSDYTYGI